MYMDSLAAASDIEIDASAAATMRSALGSTEESRRSSKSITTYKGGEMTVQSSSAGCGRCRRSTSSSSSRRTTAPSSGSPGC